MGGVVSNVPGSQIRLGPIFHGSGPNITVMSLNGRLDIGLIACPEMLPDLWELAGEFALVMAELLAATR